MNTTTKKIVLLLLPLLICAVNTASEQPVFPVKVSANGRYIVDSNGNPVFWLGTTQWQIFREYTLDEARIILEKTRSNGFVFIQAMLMGVGDGKQPNVHGQKPWINNDPLTPNEEYFKNVDSVIRIARDNRSLFLFSGSWPRDSMKEMEVSILSPLNPIRHHIHPASFTTRTGWPSTQCKRGTGST